MIGMSVSLTVTRLTCDLCINMHKVRVFDLKFYPICPRLANFFICQLDNDN